MAAQNSISRKKLREFSGKKIPVIIDAVQRKHALARSMGDAPEIDGTVKVLNAAKSVQPGDIITVHVTKTHDYDLTAEIA
jgi:ribosomal protein S12 methylthiotransferase